MRSDLKSDARFDWNRRNQPFILRAAAVLASILDVFVGSARASLIEDAYAEVRADEIVIHT